MDGVRFDNLVRTLLAGGSRRGLLRRLSALPLAGGLATLLVHAGESAAKKRKKKNKHRKNQQNSKRRQKGKVRVEGPCGDGSGPDNRCEKDHQCCTKHCDKKKRRCRCLKQGQACNNDRLCCPGRTGRTCRDGTCQPAPECDSACAGCCDSQGACQPGTAPDACGGGGTACQVCAEPTPVCGAQEPGVCGCVPTSCQAAGAECGTIVDGCGGTLPCGDCPAGEVCWENACVCGDVCASGCQFSSVQDAIDNAGAEATITICAGTFTENLTIDKELTLVGAGEDTTTLQGDGTPFTSVVTIAAGAVNLQDLRITGGTGDFGGGIHNSGTLQVTGCTITGNTSEIFGGGIYNTGTLTVEDCTISENVPDAGGDLWGGAIYNEGTLSVTNSALTGNRGNQGGGLYSENGGPVTLTGCDISDNAIFSGFVDSSNGGAIHFSGDAGLEVTDCTIRDNSAEGTGGAAYVISAAVFTNCDISFNEADFGGGIYNAGSDAELTLDNTDVTGNTCFSQGGGIYNLGTLTLAAATTVSGNWAPLDGGGIFNDGAFGSGTSTCSGGSSVSSNTPNDCVAVNDGSCDGC